jgi:hypothetical protein
MTEGGKRLQELAREIRVLAAKSTEALRQLQADLGELSLLALLLSANSRRILRKNQKKT